MRLMLLAAVDTLRWLVRSDRAEIARLADRVAELEEQNRRLVEALAEQCERNAEQARSKRP